MIAKRFVTGLYTVLFLQTFTFVAVAGTCTAPPTVSDASYTPPGSSFAINETVTYSCDTGYTNTAGDDVLTCDGTSWIGTPITCTIVTCPAVTVSDSSKLPSSAPYNYGTSITYTCDTGYYHSSGNLTRTCTASGAWDGTIPVCSVVICPAVSVSDASKLPDTAQYIYNTAVTYTCDTGFFHASGNLTRTCTAGGTWNGTTPECSVVKCQAVTVNDSSKLPDTETYIFNTPVTYTCDTGFYHASGDLMRTCTASGAWNGTAPVCSVVTCPSVTVNDSSKLPDTETYIYNTSVTYTCDTGFYFASGNLMRTCTASGAWNGTAPVCSVVTCPAVTVNDSSKLPDTETYIYNTSVTYTCDTGFYHASGDLMRTCTASGVWNGTAPVCSVVTCPVVTVNDSSKLPDTETYIYNTSVTYTCDTGFYHASGDLMRKCTASGAWNGTAPVCSVVTCPAVTVNNSSKLPDTETYIYNTPVTYTCDTGFYHASGDLMRTCTASGAWNGTAPVCSVVTCPTVTVNDSSKLPDTETYIYNTSVTYTCDTGFYLASGDLMRTCTASGAWNGTAPVCSVVTCPAVIVSHATKLPEAAQYTHGTLVTYTCDNGYFHDSGDLTRTCNISGVWDDTVPVCSVVTCAAVNVNLASKSPDYAQYNYSTSVTYTCDTGYYCSSGDLVRTCNASGAWDGTVPVCSVVTCLPDVVANSAKSPEQPSYVYNTVLTYTCVTGYELASGTLSRTCQADALWSGSTPVCSIKQCPADVVSNSLRTPDQTDYNYNMGVTYACVTGYNHTDGDLTRTCQDNKTWTGDTPVCTIITCEPPEDVVNATKDPEQASYDYNTLVSYACQTGYEITVGSASRTCLVTQTWSGTAPTCTVKMCVAPGAVAFADVLPLAAQYPYSTSITYTCHTGYEHATGDLIRTCQDSKTFSGTAPTCTIKQCDYEAVANADADPNTSKYDYNTIVTYTCHLAFAKTAGDLVRTCDASATWTGTLPTCNPSACLPDPTDHGAISPVNTTYSFGVEITYTCDAGYYHDTGDAVRTCQTTGLWDKTKPTCSRVECDPPGDISHGAYLPYLGGKYDYDANVTYACDLAFTNTSGDTMRTCQQNFTWSGSEPVCTAYACIQENSTYMDSTPNKQLHEFSDPITYACITGYNYSTGDVTRTCQTSGQWTGTLPDCVIVRCPIPDAPANTSIHPNGADVTYNETISYTCDVGYNRTGGDETRRCTETSLFDATQAVCTIVQCDPPVLVDNSTYSDVLNIYNYSMEVTYSCDFGYYYVTGDNTSTCTEHGTWTGTPPTCYIVKCPKPTEAYATFSPDQDWHIFNTTVDSTCVLGYNLTDGDATRSCQANATWDGTPPNCTIVECEMPAPVSMSTHDPQQSVYVYLDVITYTCDVGYELTSGNESRECKETGLFTGSAPNCTIKHCVPPQAGIQATYEPTLAEHDWNTTVNYSCNFGYNHTTGDLERTCQDDKTWSGDAPECIIVTCDNIDVQYMTVTPNNDTIDFNMTVEYACVIGYNHSFGDLTRTCDHTGQWTGDLPNCTIVECEMPAPVSMSTHVPQQSVYVYLDVIVYTCDVGYELTSGNESRECKETGLLTGSAPNCTIKHCVPPQAGTQTTYEPELEEHDWNTTVNYTCNFGYNHTTGDLERTCQDDKTWSGDAPECIIVTCDNIDVQYMTVTPNNDTIDFNMTVEYACVIGYNHSFGDLTRTCDHTGQWTGDLPNCTIVECDVPPPVDMSSHVPVKNVYVYLDVITYTCDIGYEITSGNKSRECKETGLLTGTAPNCTIKHCVPPQAGVQATYEPELVEHDWNTTVSYTCNIGYNHSIGDVERRCQDDKMWSGDAPECIIVTCDNIEVPFMTVTPSNETLDFNTTIEYACVVGYNHSFGDLFRTCNYTGWWTGELPNCTIITCDPPAPISHTSYEPVQVEHDWNTDIEYSCHADYHYVAGINVTTCNESGVFPPVDFDCSVEHSLTAHASEPNVKWMNITTNVTTILYDYDGYCDVDVRANPNRLDVAYEIKPGNQIEVTVEETLQTDFRVYKVILSPHKGARSWSGYKRTVFYGEEVLGLTAWLDNPIMYLAVSDSYNFEVTATQGTTTTLLSGMGDGNSYTNYDQGVFPSHTVTHTYNVSGYFNATFDLSNLVSSQSAIVPVIVIYKLNNVLFRVDNTHHNTTTSANFEFFVKGSANVPMDVMNVTINYKHGSNDSGNLDLGDSVSLPASFPYSHLFDVQGQYIVEAATVNHVSSGAYSITMDIWDTLLPLDFVVYNGTGKYITNTTAQFKFVNPPNAGFKYIIYYGDGTEVSSTNDDILYQQYNLSIFSHVYTSANLYTLRWLAWNGWNDYSRNETFTVLVQNRVPITGYTVEPIGKKYPWKNLQSMLIPVNITLNDTVPLPTDATCTFDPMDGKPIVTGLQYNSALLNHLHSYTSEGEFNGTLHCSNEVSQHTYEPNLQVEKYPAKDLGVEFENLVPMNISGTREVDFYVDSGGYALIPEEVFLGWDYGETESNARRRRAVVTFVPYNTSVYSNTYTQRGNYTITVQVQAAVTGTTNTLTYSLRVGIMYFEYDHVVAFINDTVVNYVMYGVLGTTTYRLTFDRITPDYTCSSTGYYGCNIPHMCPSYGYLLVTAIADNGTFVEVDNVNITCDNPIPPDMKFTIPSTVAIPDGFISYNFSIGSSDLYLPRLTCRINFGDPIYKKDVLESQEVTYLKPFSNRFQYIALGRHPIEITCWNLINTTTHSHIIIVTNKDFLFTGTFDRRFSQPETPLLISSIRDTEIFSRLVILANETEKTHYNLWSINATMIPGIYDKHSLLFTRGEINEDLYQVILKVSFINESSNSIFEPTWVKIVKTPPHAEIVGSRRRKVSRGTVNLDGASLSYDPARPIFPTLGYSWTCKSYDAISFENAAYKYDNGHNSSQCTTISSGLGKRILNTTAAPQKPYYVVELTINNGRGMTATHRQIIWISSQVELSIRCMFNCLAKVAVASDLQLVPDLDHNCQGVFTWEMQNMTGGVYGPSIDLSSITKTGNTNRSLTINAHSLSPGTWHLITLTAVIDGYVRKAYHEFITNKPPKGGVCDVIPFAEGPLPLNTTLPESPADYSNLTTYYAGMREFNLTCKGWTDEGYTDNTFTTDEPLFYFFFLEYKNGDTSQRQILYFDPGSTSNLVTFQLGDPDDNDEPYRATVVLRITDVFGDYAELRYDTISKPNLTTGMLINLNMAGRLVKLQEFINTFASNITKAYTTYDYRTIARKVMDITSVYNELELNTTASVTLTPEDLLSLGYKENENGERISWSDYWRLIVEVVDTSTSDYLIQVSEDYTKMIYDVIKTWPEGKKITLVAIETMSRALTSLMNRTDYTNVTAAKLAAECANILCRNLAYHVDDPLQDRPFPSTEMMWAAATAIRSLVRNIVMALQAVLTPNLPEDPTVDEMRKFLEYMQIFKTTEEVASEPLSLQEQTFLAQKQLQKYYLAKYIKSEASKEALPNITEALRNLTYVFQTVSAIGQQEVVLEDDIIYVSTEIVPANELQGFTIVRPRVAVDVPSLTEINPAECNSSAIYIRTIIFKENPYFWGSFADRISSYVPVFELDGGIIGGDTITFRLGNKVVPECRDAQPTYEKDDPNKMIYILFDRKYGDDHILLFVRPNATDLVYQLYFNVDEKPVIEDNKYIYSTEIKTDKWTQEDGYKLMIKSTEFSAIGKIWIALRPLLEKSTDLDLLTRPFCANVTSVNCLAWVQNDKEVYYWDKTLCEVSRSSSRKETECICQNPQDGTPMTVGTTFYVPPSKVDFKNIEDAIEEYGRTPVIAMIASTMIAYFLLAFWAWREDAKDQYKWSYALLIDNDIADSFFYIIKVYTGLRSYSGTRSKVGFILMGEDGRTRERILDDESHVGFDRGSVRTFVMSTRRKLGDLLCLRVWHDDSGGPAASWYLNKVVITDLQTTRRYFFESNKWLSYESGDQRVDRSLLARPIEDMRSFKDMVSYTIADSHAWVSIFLRPLRSNFTRIQRLASLLGLIYVTMIVCIMILKTPDEVQMSQVIIKPFRFSLENFWTAMIAVSVGTLVIMVVTFFFRNAEAPSKPNDIYSFTRRAYRKINDKVNLDHTVLRTTYDPPAQSTVAYDYHFLPHFCKYIGWTILLTVVGIATYLLMAFSDDWKLVKSEEWMTSIFVAFLTSMVLIEPVKILIILLFYSVFCPRAYEPPDPYVDINRLLEITKHNSATLMYGPQFENVLHTPVNPDEDTLAQNKIDRIRDHQLVRIFIQLIFFSGVLYMVYYISYQSRDPLSFYLKNHVEQQFDFENKVNNPTSYVEWLNTTFLNTYFSHTYYGAPYEETDLRDYGEDLANVRVGPARLRQLRVLPESCKGPLGVNQTCYNRYKDERSDSGDYCIKWKPRLKKCDVSQKSTYFTSAAWLYTSAEEVWGFPTIAEYTTYGGGGYFMKLDVNMEVSINIFKELVTLNWLDRATRVIILEFTIYNGNSNLFCYSKFVAEFPEVGGVVTYTDIQVFRLYSHYGPDGNFILFLEFVFLLCVIFATLKVIHELATDAITFLKSVWNLLDLLALIMAYITVSCYIYKLIIAERTTHIFREDRNAYVGFENLAFYDFLTNTTHAVLVFLLSMRVSRILGYSGKINEMAAVIAQSADDLLAFLVIFGITYFAYVAYGTLLFGKETAKYRDMFHTYGTLTEAVVGKNRLANILVSKPGFAEFYYFTFVLFVLMTLMTMAAAILNFSISSVKEENEKVAPTNIVEVIFDRVASIFRRLGALTGRKGAKYKPSKRRNSDSELNAILTELRQFLRTVHTNGDPKKDSGGYRAISPDDSRGNIPPVFGKGGFGAREK